MTCVATLVEAIILTRIPANHGKKHYKGGTICTRTFHNWSPEEEEEQEECSNVNLLAYHHFPLIYLKNKSQRCSLGEEATRNLLDLLRLH